MYGQIFAYIEHFLGKLLFGFRKAHSTQHAFFRLLQQWQCELDLGGFATLMDLSKGYVFLPYNPLIAKLKAYGLDCNSLTLILD